MKEKKIKKNKKKIKETLKPQYNQKWDAKTDFHLTFTKFYLD